MATGQGAQGRLAAGRGRPACAAAAVMAQPAWVLTRSLGSHTTAQYGCLLPASIYLRSLTH